MEEDSRQIMGGSVQIEEDSEQVDENSQPYIQNEGSLMGYDDIVYRNPFLSAPKELKKLGIQTIDVGVTDFLQRYLKKYRCRKSTKECVFCLRIFEFNSLMVQLPCNHFFHDECLKRYINMKYSF